MSNNRRIFFVDDTEDYLGLYRQTFRRTDHETPFAADGIAGLEAARQFEPHLVILDIMMPGMHGMEVLQQLRSDNISEKHALSNGRRVIANQQPLYRSSLTFLGVLPPQFLEVMHRPWTFHFAPPRND